MWCHAKHVWAPAIVCGVLIGVVLDELIAPAAARPPVQSSPVAPRWRETPDLRRLRPGETRVLGTLAGLVCERRFTVVAVRTEKGLLRLRQNPSRTVEYISYVPSGPSSIGCGPLDPEPRVLATYTTEGRIPSGMQGDAVAIEFIPANFMR
jgi:hypothetical protein